MIIIIIIIITIIIIIIIIIIIYYYYYFLLFCYFAIHGINANACCWKLPSLTKLYYFHRCLICFASYFFQNDGVNMQNLSSISSVLPMAITYHISWLKMDGALSVFTTMIFVQVAILENGGLQKSPKIRLALQVLFSISKGPRITQNDNVPCTYIFRDPVTDPV